MNFYLLDNLKQILEDTSKNPNARARYRWSPAFPINKRGTEADFCPTCGLPVSMMHWAQPRILSFRGKKFADRLWKIFLQNLLFPSGLRTFMNKMGLLGLLLLNRSMKYVFRKSSILTHRSTMLRKFRSPRKSSSIQIPPL